MAQVPANGDGDTIPGAGQPRYDFELRVDFVSGEGEPSRIFEAMTQLVRAVQSLDEELCRSLGATCTSRLVLQDVDSGSLLARFAEIVEELPDEALRNAEWNKIIGHFLVRGKYAFLRWCNRRKKISGRDEVIELQDELLEEAKASQLKIMPLYAPIPVDRVVMVAQRLQMAVAILGSGETASIGSILGNLTIEPGLNVPDSVIEDLVTREVLEAEGVRIVKVKKPDYIGRSMWSLKYGDSAIDAHMRDVDWLARFQSALEPVHPGDSLRVRMRERVSYGYQGDVVQKHYDILEVIDVVKASPVQQIGLIGEGM